MLARNNVGLLSLVLCIAMGASPLTAYAAGVPAVLPDPDGKPGSTAKPIKVFFLSGQSNMCGMGKPASLKSLATADPKFGYLVDDNGNWTVRQDVIYRFGSRKINGPLTLDRAVGPEHGIGHVLGTYYDEQVLLIKQAEGNRSLGHDFLPPSSRKRLGKPVWPPEQYEEQRKKAGWYGGISYDKQVSRAKQYLADIANNMPGYKGQGFEVAGFFWWQGHKDRGSSKEKYEGHLVDLINDFRKDFNAPNAPFVVATVGFSGMKLGAWKGVWEAQMAVGDPSQHPEYRGNVGSVDIRDIGGGGFHYGCNGGRYTKIGDRMGRAMVKLLDYAAAKKAKPKPEKKTVAAAKPEAPSDTAKERSARRLLRTARDAERMGQRSLAMTFYKKIVNEYPDTDAAKKAEVKLK